MKNIYTWAAKPARRTVTVGDLKALKGKKKFTQVKKLIKKNLVNII